MYIANLRLIFNHYGVLTQFPVIILTNDLLVNCTCGFVGIQITLLLLFTKLVLDSQCLHTLHHNEGSLS